jgi:DNA-binding transcriptional regulator YbjK
MQEGIAMIGNESQRQALTLQEWNDLAEGVELEEQLICLYTQAAVECMLPQLRQYFAHEAETTLERLAEMVQFMHQHATPSHRTVG